MRTIICRNEDGLEGVFTERFNDDRSNLIIENCDGIYSAVNSVTTSANTMTDGSTYQGSVAKQRNIVLTLRDHPTADHEATRNFLFQLFKAGSLATLIYRYPGRDDREINYYVESVVVDGTLNARQATVSLVCPDPFFYAIDDIRVYMSSWNGNFTFPHTFKATGEWFGYKSAEKLQNVVNKNAASGIGMTIRIEANGSVTNPTITHITDEKHITVGTASKPLKLIAGDILTITTANNNKHIYVTHDGNKVEANEYLTEDSEFIQLGAGDNYIGYSAESGTDNLVVEISYRLKFVGA